MIPCEWGGGSCKGCLLRRLILVSSSSSLWKKSDQFNLSAFAQKPTLLCLPVIYPYLLSRPHISKGPEVVNKCNLGR